METDIAKVSSSDLFKELDRRWSLDEKEEHFISAARLTSRVAPLLDFMHPRMRKVVAELPEPEDAMKHLFPNLYARMERAEGDRADLLELIQRCLAAQDLDLAQSAYSDARAMLVRCGIFY